MSNEVAVNEAMDIIYELLMITEEAENSLKSARNWSFVDLLGGGLISGLIKHSKINTARNNMAEVNVLMKRLQTVLGSISVPRDYSINISGFATFADFFFDGTLFDGIMTLKILDNLNDVRELRQRLMLLRDKLTDFKRNC